MANPAHNWEHNQQESFYPCNAEPIKCCWHPYTHLDIPQIKLVKWSISLLPRDQELDNQVSTIWPTERHNFSFTEWYKTAREWEAKEEAEEESILLAREIHPSSTEMIFGKQDALFLHAMCWTADIQVATTTIKNSKINKLLCTNSLMNHMLWLNK